ncbi:1-aminocyclopropane-1-carboxylate oxidase homolog 7 [Brassica napus]|uniref:Fe2OG dioxygenase domain-containing protein n=3 Tax=Brassica TaxID=3705 RepID=A0A0D3DIT4_BRAOL|nr:1-aminocyclopropane-1-carboxylate oxidase homolog 7 [Brassica napus]CAF2105259.1 unnamed protein product [Brassica napus]VDD53682.1 unnamed protein product [Brassica oleracea]
MAPDLPDPEELPVACRDAMIGYSDHVKRLGGLIFELVSEALGLSPETLKRMDCAKDQVGGLQVLHQDCWVDVTPIPRALIINFGDFLQMMTNNKFISVNHSVLANRVGPRISVACFFCYPTNLNSTA